jgi:hypothetical protein
LEGTVTLRAVQAGILLFIYELWHGIFPAAFMTISHCARQGVALGLHSKLGPQLAGKPRSWVDWEERQRVWWAIVILDMLGKHTTGPSFRLRGAVCANTALSDFWLLRVIIVRHAPSTQGGTHFCRLMMALEIVV